MERYNLVPVSMASVLPLSEKDSGNRGGSLCFHALHCFSVVSERVMVTVVVLNVSGKGLGKKRKGEE